MATATLEPPPPSVEELAAASPRRPITRAEYMAMGAAGILPEGERTELIRGEIRRMVPPSPGHNDSTLGLIEVLRAAFAGTHFIRPQLPLSLLSDEMPEPDIAVVRGTRHDWRGRHPDSADLVVEVSLSSLAYDRTEKASLYAAAGVPDYWIVNLAARRLEVRRVPIADPAEPYGARYSTHTLFPEGDSVSPLARPDAAVAVSDLL